jgi:predicted RND superfamily exporter protein
VPRSQNEVWHSSYLWVRAEAEELVIDSTVRSIFIGILCAAFAMLLFTRSFAATSGLVLVVTSIVLLVAAAMGAVLDWTMGPVEVISLIVFLGYCVTYCIHIAHAYVSPDLDGRTTENRIQVALLRLGPATIFSALTTVMTCLFLGACTIRIFNQFGIVLFLTTFFGLLAALTVLPSFLTLTYGLRLDFFRRKARRVEPNTEPPSGAIVPAPVSPRDPGDDRGTVEMAHVRGR